MFEKAALMFLYALTQTHVGSGSNVAGVDLPIQRERTTRYPTWQATGLKGCFRDVAEARDRKPDIVDILFGSRPQRGQPPRNAGLLGFTDARLLLLPISSWAGVFAWVTCPMVLERFRLDLAIFGLPLPMNGGLHSIEPGTCLVGSTPSIKIPAARQSPVMPADSVVLDDRYKFLAREETSLDGFGQWLAERTLDFVEGKSPESTLTITSAMGFWAKKLKRDIVVIPDDDFTHFARTATAIETRVAIGEQGTVEQGPWDEELLPAETLLYSLVLSPDPERAGVKGNKVLTDAAAALGELRNLAFGEKGNAGVLQLGGDASVGRGLVFARMDLDSV